MKRRDILKGSVMMSVGLTAGNGNAASPDDENPFPPLKIVPKDPPRYSPLVYLEKVHDDNPPRLAFNEKDAQRAGRWQKNLRKKLWELMGENPHEPDSATPQARKLSSEACDGFTREKWEIDVLPGRSMPFYVLLPEKRTEDKTVLCLHGHGNGAKDIAGLPVDDEAEELIGILNTDYAVQCVKRGWVAVAPELFTFGERLDLVEGARPGFDGGCEKPSLNALQVGKTLIGVRVKDVCALIDWMGGRDEYNLADLACIGLSGGGMITMYTSAVDQRIKNALIAGYVTEMKGSILGVRHCSCNYIPRLACWMDFPDIAGLIAPRRLIVQSGRRDAIFPIESARKAYKKIQKIYEVAGFPENLRMDEHNGFHEFWSPSLDTLFL